tara:strand:+ start:1433 stop:1852 length:420 start_codon:yes stop_codon:yes gene_type:complete
VAGHVLYDARLLTGQFANAVLVLSGAGIELAGFIDSRFQVGLCRSAGQIGAGDVDLKCGFFGVSRYDIKIFQIHRYYTLSFMKRTAAKPIYFGVAGLWPATDNGAVLSAFILPSHSPVTHFFADFLYNTDYQHPVLNTG